MSQDTFYVTTPIYYVNGNPHIGHAYTTTIADTVARYMRLKGRNVFLLTGIDEHGQKVLEAATQRGMSPKEHCDDLAVRWKKMMDDLSITYDRFMRTTDADHEALVQAVLQSLYDQGLIYKDEYIGWYSIRAEQFFTEKDLVDGKCPETGGPVEQIKETNYFFKMSNYHQQLIDYIEANPSFIQPESRKNEVLGFLAKGLGDLCISRPKSRMSWGIEMPFDEDYVTYVWFDALLNYLTGAGYTLDGDTWKGQWPANLQLVGKDILTTHAVYWTTMLMAMDVPLPETLFAHGWWKDKDGQKMSKSLGNTVDVDALVECYGLDAVRNHFLRAIRFGADGNFDYPGFQTAYNAALADKYGNLAHRGLTQTAKWLSGVVPALGELTELELELRAIATKAVLAFDAGMTEYRFDDALDSLWELVIAGNGYIDTTEPWTLNKNGDMARLGTVERHVLEISLLVATMTAAIMPSKADELREKLGHGADTLQGDFQRFLAQAQGEGITLDALTEGRALVTGDPLFPRIKKLPPQIQALVDVLDAAEAERKATLKAEKAAKKAQRKKSKPAIPEPPAEIEFTDFAKVKLRVGKVVEADKHPDADRLLVLKVDIGEETPRTIVAGIATKFSPEALVGRQVVVVANLKPAKMRGITSEGMLLAAGGKEVVDLVTVNAEPGETVR